MSWSNEGDFDNNPVFRYFGLMMDKMVGPDAEESLASRKTLIEKQVTDEATAKAAEIAAAAATPVATATSAEPIKADPPKAVPSPRKS